MDKLPLILLPHKRMALIVGGGTAAYKKAITLQSSGMPLRIVASSCSTELRQLLPPSHIVERPVVKADIRDAFLVIAATNSKATNTQVLHWAREYSRPALRVDANWDESDFIFPAIYRDDDITLAITTGGVSCQKAKFVKESLATQLSFTNTLDIYHITLVASSPQKSKHYLCDIRSIHEYCIVGTDTNHSIVCVGTGGAPFAPLLCSLYGSDTISILSGISAVQATQNLSSVELLQSYRYAQECGWAKSLLRKYITALCSTEKDPEVIYTSTLKGLYDNRC